MHKTSYQKLRINTFLLQFFGFLSRGLFSNEDRKAMSELIEQNIDRLELMRDTFKWDGRYDLVITQLFKTEEYLRRAKEKLRFKQICDDEDIAEYLHNHPKFFNEGIELKDLRKLLDIREKLDEGYMLHDVYHGYPEHFYSFQIDCLDYLNSAAHFYNEGYDFYYERKKHKDYSEIDFSKVHFTEQKRVPTQPELIFRNFREAYINLIFFGESFINSVGYDAYLNDLARNEKERLALRGIKPDKKSYLSIAAKLKEFTKIIGGISIDIGLEPYRTYLHQYVQLRNQYLHSSPDKGKMRLGIDDWKSKCDELIDGRCIEFLETFWKSCYPQKMFPKVIFNSFYSNAFKGRPGKMYV